SRFPVARSPVRSALETGERRTENQKWETVGSASAAPPGGGFGWRGARARDEESKESFAQGQASFHSSIHGDHFKRCKIPLAAEGLLCRLESRVGRAPLDNLHELGRPNFPGDRRNMRGGRCRRAKG